MFYLCYPSNLNEILNYINYFINYHYNYTIQLHNKLK